MLTYYFGYEAIKTPSEDDTGLKTDEVQTTYATVYVISIRSAVKFRFEENTNTDKGVPERNITAGLNRRREQAT